MDVPAPRCLLLASFTSADTVNSPDVQTAFLPPLTASPALTVSRMLLSLRPRIGRTVVTTASSARNVHPPSSHVLL